MMVNVGQLPSNQMYHVTTGSPRPSELWNCVIKYLLVGVSIITSVTKQPVLSPRLLVLKPKVYIKIKSPKVIKRRDRKI